jgi:hypothetical protein
VTLPAVVIVLAACLSGMRLAGDQLRVQDAAAVAARAAARGGDPGVASRLVPGSSIERADRDDLVCVRVSLRASDPLGALARVTLTASSCALGGGR